MQQIEKNWDKFQDMRETQYHLRNNIFLEYDTCQKPSSKNGTFRTIDSFSRSELKINKYCKLATFVVETCIRLSWDWHRMRISNKKVTTEYFPLFFYKIELLFIKVRNNLWQVFWKLNYKYVLNKIIFY